MADDFDWKKPDYDPVWSARAARLTRIRQWPEAERPQMLAQLRAYYRDNPIDFIQDWGCTIDPRRIELGLSPMMPFILFPKQREFLQFIMDKWRAQRPGLADKSRDSGFSWLVIALGCTLCLHHDGMVIGYGSRKEDYVDKIGDPKSLFYKARIFMQELPVEFRGGWMLARHASHMRIVFPMSGATMTGESGDSIGRGNRTSIYFVDESAFLERPHRVEMSLSQTTNCRIDISTPNGLGNPFEQKRHGGKIEVFTMHWRDDPRKDQAWYDKQCEDLDPVTIAQEIDIDYSASVEGVLIPHAWILSAIDLHKKMGIKPTGSRWGSLDVADEGKDKNAFCGAHGFMLEHLEEWSGKGDDIFGTTQRAFAICQELGYERLRYDADGLGAGVRGDARVLNEKRALDKLRPIQIEAFRGSAGVFEPLAEDVKGRKNEDYFANCKSQSWWSLRTRFMKVHRWVTKGVPVPYDEVIAIPADLKNCTRLIGELSQPTYRVNSSGKILIDKAPDGTKSPNLADAVMSRFATISKGPLRISAGVLARAGRAR